MAVRVRRPRHRFVLTLVALLAALVAADFAASFFVPTSGVTSPGLFIPDAVRGSALQPGFHATMTRAGHRFEVTINKNGYRDAEWNLEDTRPRVLVVGSSATFAVGLPREAGIAAQLAAQLGSDVVVLNTGTYTYGLVSELETIRRECPATHPFLVLYIHEYKNTRRDFLELRPVEADDAPSADTVARWGVTLPALRTLLSINGLHPRQLVERMIGLDRLPRSYVERYAMTTGPGFAPENAGRAAALIEDMDEAAQHCGAQFLMAVLPGPAEAYYGLREPATEALLAALRTAGSGDKVVDTRPSIPLGCDCFLSAYDYPSATGPEASLVAVVGQPVELGWVFAADTVEYRCHDQLADVHDPTPLRKTRLAHP